MEGSFSSDTVNGLRSLSREDVVPNAAFKDLVGFAFGILARQPGAKEELMYENGNLKQIDRAVLKQTYAAVATLIVESVKTDSSAEALGRGLDDIGMPAPRIQLLSQMYGDNSARIRDVLTRTGFDLPNLADVNWRLDYHVRSSNTGRANTPLYLFQLKTTEGDSKSRDIQFSCNREQAEEMLRSVRDATNQVERLLKAAQAGN